MARPPGLAPSSGPGRTASGAGGAPRNSAPSRGCSRPTRFPALGLAVLRSRHRPPAGVGESPGKTRPLARGAARRDCPSLLIRSKSRRGPWAGAQTQGALWRRARERRAARRAEPGETPSQAVEPAPALSKGQTVHAPSRAYLMSTARSMAGRVLPGTRMFNKSCHTQGPSTTAKLEQTLDKTWSRARGLLQQKLEQGLGKPCVFQSWPVYS